MSATPRKSSYVCSRCLQRASAGDIGFAARIRSRRWVHTTAAQYGTDSGKDADPPEHRQKQGAMSRRLEEMTEQSLEEGGKRAQKAVHEAGFSEELKQRLEQRIADSQAGRLDPKASAALSLPASAGRGTADVAMAKPWSGSETVEEQSLRMLTDAHKPLRTGRRGRLATPKGLPSGIDTRMKQAVKASSGARLANARDRTSIYAISQDPSLTEKEKEEMRQMLKDRFQPGARPMPNSIQGLTSLANERIEDAIARGQFKNIARGKGVNTEVDYNANSPFLNTTEYFMNKMIQRQDIVPPWIEKQQEVVKTAQAFRSRLRNDWKRHAARTIASKGGSLRDQIRRAEAYAVAEAEFNPKAQKVEAIRAIDSAGKLTQINVVETPGVEKTAATGGTDSTKSEQPVLVDTKITVVETPPGIPSAVAVADAAMRPTVPSNDESDGAAAAQGDQSGTDEGTLSPSTHASNELEPLPRLPPFRDQTWESIELAYHRAALKELNNLTRSYNLMAPELAKRPYFSLDRELAACFADVAPQLASEIKERARRPEKVRVEIVGHKPGGVLERFGGETAKVYDSKKPHYGFKQFWQDLWNSHDERRT